MDRKLFIVFVDHISQEQSGVPSNGHKSDTSHVAEFGHHMARARAPESVRRDVWLGYPFIFGPVLDYHTP